jgi:hypothetical protein
MQTDLVTEVHHNGKEPTNGRDEAEGTRYLFAGIAVASIWIAVAIASVWSPDMITGSQHEHLPIAAFGDWLYAAIATGLVLLAFSRARAASRSLWVGFTVAIATVWLIVALASVFAPSMVTGADPTTIPIAAFASPIGGVVATAFVCVFAAGSRGRAESS